MPLGGTGADPMVPFWSRPGKIVLALTAWTTSVSAQQAGPRQATGPAWGMLPISVEMPVLPGLEGAVPSVGPYLPGAGLEVSTLPEARGSETVHAEDGDTIDISVSLVRRTVEGRQLIMFGYNGQHPGPLIRAPRGATFTVRVTNEIRMPTTVHWHGVRIENRYDGVPGLTQDPIEPGESFAYEVNVPDAGMFWYHPHGREDVQLDLGLFGKFANIASDAVVKASSEREEYI